MHTKIKVNIELDQKLILTYLTQYFIREVIKMEENWKSRTELLIGKENIEKLNKSKIAIYGIGGVGSFVVEGLARAGIENFVLIDNDIISISNINRQIHANINTIGKRKIDVMKERIEEINPNASVEIYMTQDVEDGEENLINKEITYVVDAVDTVTTKLKLIEKAKQEEVPIISSMGTGNKLDPTRFEISDITKTSVCPLAKVIRKELKKRNIRNVKVLYSKEEPIKIKEEEIECENRRKQTPGSISFVPSVAGMIIAGEVIKDVINRQRIKNIYFNINLYSCSFINKIINVWLSSLVTVIEFTLLIVSLKLVKDI